ncbi:MAG: RnfABCDGE type electron transport complex subunit D [Clostridia bacterium]|nr:RnfABCDGE type electron transport complex subunit D [Clostridia bacterium]
MSRLHISPAPHIHQKGASVNRVMLDVIIAMIPAALVGVIFFGLKALWIILTCVASAVLAEFIFNLCAHKKQTIGDLSAVVTGLLLALNLSTEVKLWQCAVGSVFAIVVVKCFFGGIGKNIVNPAIAARVFMLLTFGSVAAVSKIAPLFDLGFLGNAVPEIAAGATPLASLNAGVEGAANAPTVLQLLVGAHGGAIGETCAIALLLGFVYLVARKVIKWYVPASFVATVFVCYLIFGGFDVTFALQHVLAGGLLLGAIFMATDYVTTPTTNLGRVVFCVGAGLLTFAIRQFASYPEGVSIAILTMNLLTPFIYDWTKKRTLGGVK